MSKREVERFQARGTSGMIYTIIRWAEQVTHKPLSGGMVTTDGAQVLQLTDGRHVNEIMLGKRYEIFDTDETLERC